MEKDKLCIHAGGKMATLEELQAVPMPEKTNTYTPVGHYDLVMNVQRVASDMLGPKGFTVVKDQYALAREGQRMFGLLSFKGVDPETGLAVGMRNSYDKSMSCGLCFGASVFICDNLAFAGDVTVMRRHTGNIEDDLIAGLLKAFYNVTEKYQYLQKTFEVFRKKELTEDEGYRVLGSLLGNEVLPHSVILAALKEWKTPSFDPFKTRTAWSLYNAVTFALKGSPVNQMFERHLVVQKQFETMYPGG